MYNYNPATTGYSPTFGGIPGQVSGPDPAADLAAQYPNLSASTGQASTDVLAKLRGELSPGTINSIQDAAARFGVSSGMPGFTPGSLAGNRGLRDIGLNAEAQTQQGLQDYNALTSNVSQTQTVNPALQANIAEQNAINASAPNPQAAQSYAEDLFNKYLDKIQPKGGGGFSIGGGQGGRSGGSSFGSLNSTMFPGSTFGNAPHQSPYSIWDSGSGQSNVSLLPWDSSQTMSPFGESDPSFW